MELELELECEELEELDRLLLELLREELELEFEELDDESITGGASIYPTAAIWA